VSRRRASLHCLRLGPAHAPLCAWACELVFVLLFGLKLCLDQHARAGMAYLVWYRRVLRIPVCNEFKLDLIRPMPESGRGTVYELHIMTPGGAEKLYARKVRDTGIALHGLRSPLAVGGAAGWDVGRGAAGGGGAAGGCSGTDRARTMGSPCACRLELVVEDLGRRRATSADAPPPRIAPCAQVVLATGIQGGGECETPPARARAVAVLPLPCPAALLAAAHAMDLAKTWSGGRSVAVNIEAAL
jgi:hypothetical protein